MVIMNLSIVISIDLLCKKMFVNLYKYYNA